jgi:hypothetical protein
VAGREYFLRNDAAGTINEPQPEAAGLPSTATYPAWHFNDVLMLDRPALAKF